MLGAPASADLPEVRPDVKLPPPSALTLYVRLPILKREFHPAATQIRPAHRDAPAAPKFENPVIQIDDRIFHR